VARCDYKICRLFAIFANQTFIITSLPALFTVIFMVLPQFLTLLSTDGKTETQALEAW
jgi:hypothetical protein